MYEADEPHQLPGAGKEGDGEAGSGFLFSDNTPIRVWFDHLPIALLVLEGENYRIKLANSLAIQLWGRNQTGWVGKSFLEVLCHPEGDTVKERLDRVFQTGKPEAAPEMAFQLDQEGQSEKVYYKVNFQPVENPPGTVLGITLTAVEITQQVRTRQSSERKTQYIEQLLDGIPQMLWTANEQGVHTFFNQQWYEFTGAKHSQIEQSWQTHIHPEDLAPILSQWQACVQSKQPFQAQYRLRHWQGNYRWMLIEALPNFDQQGRFTEWIGTCTDIHEQKLAFEQVSQQQAQLRALIDNNPDVITRWDTNLKLLFANAAFHQKTGMPIASLLGKNNLQMGQPQEVAIPWMEAIGRVIQTGKPTEHYNSFSTPQGEAHFYSRLVPEFAPDYSVQSVLAIARDISELKNAQKDLEQAFFELDSFVYRASHDIMAPLKSILGLVNILQLETDPEEQGKYLDLIKRSVNKLDTFILDLTNYSRNSRLPLQVSAIDFEQLITQSLQELSYMKGAERVNVLVEVKQQTPFYSDPMRIKVLLHNFISNAFKYQNHQRTDPYLSIQIHCGEKQAHMEIQDNGIGIPEESLGRIFDMFYRASADSFGSGLGLYIVKQVVEKLAGTITGVESQLGKGTRFVLVLPNLAENTVMPATT